MKKQLKKSSDSGFTIIEMLVVIFIIVLLSSGLFGISQHTDDKLAMQRAAFQMSQDFREIQEMAISAQVATCKTGGARFSSVFCMYFEKQGGIWNDYYSLFVDCNDPNNFTPQDTPDVAIRDFALPNGTKILSASVRGGNVNKFGVCFVPPDPIVYLKDSTAPGDAVITLCLKDDETVTRGIKINTAGRIEVTE